MANIFMIMLPLLILCFMFPPTTCFNHQTDLLSLLAFKTSIDLDPHGALNSWNQTLHLCSWNGIRCSRRHRDRVIGINLMSQGLVGSLSPYIGNLSFLRAIILKNNTFHSQIPTQIGGLRRLEFVELSNNSFVGPIPTNLSRCPNLVYLNLIDNHLTGTIPVELGSLSKLEALGLAKNNLLGPIPSFIGNMTSLERLSLSACGLAGEIPESLAQLQKLRFLQLSDNGLTGTIPSALFNMSAIQYFVVYNNQLHGVIPSAIGLTLPNLMSIHLWGNHFSGPIPASISNASLLEYIAFSMNNFTGPLPRLATLNHLQSFMIQHNFIEDDISFISSLTNSTELKYLELGTNLLSGSLPDSVGNLSINLRSLYIGKNNIHGKIPLGIGNLISLTSLLLFKNHFEGSIPPDITKLSNLIDFYAHKNKFSQELPASLFGNFSFLSHLFLGHNFFWGNLPKTLGNCTNLIEFDLSHNNFNGHIPQEIMRLSSISIIFNLSYNAFDGLIPNEVGSMINLLALDLSNNRLSGKIPNSLCHCETLQKLSLQGNLLEGEIPAGISALTGLQYLDLSRNNLSGQIPNFLGKLNLTNLNLSFNRLNGEVPVTGVFKNKTSVSLDGNRQLCGGISELKLPPCFPSKSHKKILPTLLKILVPMLGVGSMCLVILVIFTYKQRASLKNVTPASFSGVQFMRLPYADLLKATGGFAEINLLGAGKFGTVYKGILDEHGGTQVAVKVLNLFVQGASKSFMAECNALREVRHRNLLNILTVCESIDYQGNEFKALVYEFKTNGSLEKWLHHNKEQECEQHGESTSLTMIQRLNISLDIAQAIEYLHLGIESIIVHGDLKPSNILLDQDMTACLGDFGLAKIVSDIVPSNESITSTGIRGTIGYVPPEYGVTLSVSAQGDVYSYGIVLLEMFTNIRPIDDFLMDNVNLHNFVSSALPDRAMEIVDPQIQMDGHVNSYKIKDCMTSILSIGVSCSNEMAKDRMSITDVVNELRKIQMLLRR